MSIDIQPQNTALTIICRIEAGCLGPEGKSHVDKFCQFAHDNSTFKKKNFAQWQFSPRETFTLPEIQYQIANKNLSHSMASRYLTALGENIDKLEDEINDKLVTLVEEYFDRQS